MTQPQFVTQPCPKCSTPVQIAPQAGLGVCTKCYTQVAYNAAQSAQIQVGADSATAPNSAPSSIPATTVSTPSMKDLMSNPGQAVSQLGQRYGKAGAIAAAIIVAAGALGFKYVKTHYMGSGANHAGYGALGLDKDHLEADQLVSSVEKYAKRWRSDAVLWEISIPMFRADGTASVESNPQVVFASVSKVQALSKSGREDSIKKFVFGAVDVNYDRKWNAMDQWKDFSAPPVPQCTLKDLGAKLAAAGLAQDQFAHVSFNPQFSLNWRVLSPETIEGEYSASDCEKIK